MNRYNLFFFPLIAALVWYACTPSASSFAIEQPENWPVYGGLGSNQYSALNQINRDNVQQLELAWQFNSGDKDPQNRTQIQCNPLIVDGMLFGSTPTVKFFALNGATGQEIWRFDPFDGAYDQFGMGVNRGVAYWSDGQEARLLCSAADYLYCLDAKTGSLMADFGEGGKLNLRLGLGEDAQERFVSGNTPGVVYKDLLIMGMRVSEGTDAAPGFIRAFDVKTGALVWTFHTIPRPGEFGHVTWPEDAWQRVGGANSWAGVTLDEQRGIVYVPTGSASYDFYGGNRHGDNLFANCVLALDATTGERIWHYQTIHHDLWDRDLPAAPNLVRVTHNGQKKDAVAQITKHGYVFLLDRETGEPLFEVQEVPAPASSLPGELAAETQPLPVKPPPFSRQTLDADNVTNLSPEVRQWALDSLTKINPDTDFLPPSREGTIIFPGFDGGGEWGGAAFDESSGIMYVNASEMAWIQTMVPIEHQNDGTLASQGKALYMTSCAVCHGADKQGGEFMGGIPALHQLEEKYEKADLQTLISQGKGVMPAFAQYDEDQLDQLTAFLLNTDEEAREESKESKMDQLPFAATGYHRFKDPDGYPAIKPPWGTLSAIDLNLGEILWQIPLGEYPELTAKGVPPTGTENYGGPAVTAGGLIFIAASRDEKFRAFDKETGELLWETQLPAAGYATPSVYAVDGQQFVVIAAGGGKTGTKSGDAYLAFALPTEEGKP